MGIVSYNLSNSSLPRNFIVCYLAVTRIPYPNGEDNRIMPFFKNEGYFYFRTKPTKNRVLHNSIVIQGGIQESAEID